MEWSKYDIVTTESKTARKPKTTWLGCHQNRFRKKKQYKTNEIKWDTQKKKTSNDNNNSYRKTELNQK